MHMLTDYFSSAALAAIGRIARAVHHGHAAGETIKNRLERSAGVVSLADGARNRESDYPLDLVCGRRIDARDGYSSAYGDRVYHFCSQQCRDMFASRPYWYAGRTGPAATP
ncbi:MAG: hypothetical protein WBV61_03270 [Rhodanobacteraceae bacterium]